MEEYEHKLDFFRNLILNESAAWNGKPIPSSTPAQAAAAMEVFFAKAESSICILTGGLNARIYGTRGVVDEAKKFLADEKHYLNIIFLNQISSTKFQQHPLLYSLMGASNLRVRRAPADVAEQMPFHFWLLDGQSYRFKRQASSHASIISFGDEEFSAKLKRIFYHIFEESAEIKVPEYAET